METPTASKGSLHPILWIAAIAVTLFSVIGIAALTGLLPGSKSEPTPPVAAIEPPPPMPTAEPEPVPAPQPTAVAPAPEKKTAAKPAPKHKETATYSSKPKGADEHTATYTAQPAPPPPCPDCAVISAITPVTEKGEGTGLGAIAGGILGGVIGNQIGGGSGRDVARIAGIAGGAYAGHQVEKSQRSHTVFDITVRFEDGSSQVIRESAEPIWQVGDKVRVQSGKLTPR
jgi:outer membrane lipoprotein SlyB